MTVLVGRLVLVLAVVAVDVAGSGVVDGICVGAGVSLGMADGNSVTVGNGVIVAPGVLVGTFGTLSERPALILVV